MAADGETWVVPMLGGNPDKNLGTTFRKIVTTEAGSTHRSPKPKNSVMASMQTVEECVEAVLNES